MKKNISGITPPLKTENIEKYESVNDCPQYANAHTADIINIIIILDIIPCISLLNKLRLTKLAAIIDIIIIHITVKPLKLGIVDIYIQLKNLYKNKYAIIT